MESNRSRLYRSDWRRNRYFSESIKRKCVRDIERNRATVREISRQYEVSTTAVYKWVHKYSSYLKKGVKQVVEPMSDTRKIKELQARIQELERMVGQKQIRVEFYEKMIELAEKDLGIDIKKKGGSSPFDGAGKTGNK